MHDTGMRSIFVAMTGFSLGASMVYALTPAFGKTTLGASASAYGIMIGAMGLGAVIGAPALKRFRAWKEPRVVVAVLLEHGGEGGGLPAQIGAQLLSSTLGSIPA